MDAEFCEGVSFVLSELDEDIASRLAPTLTDYLERSFSDDTGWQVLDPSISGEDGGAAFLWIDVLAIGDAVDVAGDLLGELSPLDAAKLIVKMVLLWRRLRQVRVHLSKDEFKVLRAVKRGCKSTINIVDYTGFTAERVEQTIQGLSSQHYREEIPLVMKTQDGFITKF